MKREFFIVSTLYTIFAIAFTYPLILHMHSSIPTGAFSHYDPYLNVWVLAWDRFILFSDPFNFYNAPIFFPEDETLAYSEHMLGNLLITLPFGIFDNPVLKYNLCFLLTMIISGIGMYYLYKHISKEKTAAFIVGVFFTFSMLKFRYISVLQIQSFHWVPFALLFFIRFAESKEHKDLFLFLVFVFLSALTTIYITLMFGIYLTFFSLLLLLLTGVKYFNKTFFLRLLPFLIITLSLILLFHLPYLKLSLSGFYISYPKRGTEVLSNSASISSYLSIPPHAWLWSRLSASHISLNGLSPGIFLTLLAIAGIFYILRDKKGFTSSLFLSISLAGFISFLLSFGPKIFLYQFLSLILPIIKGIRIPDRFSLFFLFSLSILAGRFVQEFRGKRIFLILSFLLFLLENYPGPVRLKQVEEVLEPEPVYLWLRDHVEDGGVLELPLPRDFDELWLDVRYTMNSIHHWRRIVNGYSGYHPDSYLRIREAVFKGFPKRETLLLLKNFGIKLIIVHTEYFDKEIWVQLSRFIKENPLIPLVDFGTDKVYKISDDLS